MKRPLFAFSLFFLAAMTVAQLWGGLSGFAPVGGVLLVSVCFPAGDRRAAGRLLLCGALAALLALPVYGGFQLRLERWRKLEGQVLPFTAWVEEENPYSPGRLTLRGRVGEEGRSIRLDIQGMGEDSVVPGQWFSGSFLVLEAREDGEALGGVSLFGRAVEDPEAIPAPAGLHPLAGIAALRWRLSESIWESSPGDPSAVLLAMIFSRSDKLSDLRLEQLERAGLRHLLVVSGLHLSILTGWLHRDSLSGRRSRLFLGLLLVWGMAGLAGFSTSVLRAAVMTSLFLLGQILFLQTDSLTSLGVAGLILCVLSPPVLFRTGFQLTFAATLGILLGMDPLLTLFVSRWTARFGSPGPKTRWVLEGFAASLSAQLGALPALAAHFGSFTLWGLITTFLAIPLVTGILILGGLGAVLLLFSSTIAQLLLFPARVLASLFLLLGEGVSHLPSLSFLVLLPWQLALCFCLPAAVFLCLHLAPKLKRRRGRLLLGGCLCGAILFLASLWASAQAGTVVSVGSSGAVVLATPRGTLVLDAGESAWERRALSSQLLRCGAREPLVLASSGELSVNGALWLYQEFSPSRFFLGGEDIALLETQYPADYLPLGPEKVQVLPGVFLSRPQEKTLLVETAGRKVLKSQASYAIIVESALPEEADLFIGRSGAVYSGGSGLALSQMPSGDRNLIIY